MAPTELKLLLVGTSRMYWSALTEAFTGFKRNWWGAFLPVVYLPILSFLAPIIFGLFGPLVSGFALGLVGTLCLASYLSFVSAAVEKDRVTFSEIWPRTVQVFWAILGALFFIWLFFLLVRMVLAGSKQLWILSMLNLFVVVAFNPLAEVAYQRRRDSMSNLAESLEFMKENVFEWLLPIVVPFLPLILADPEGFFLSFAYANPLHMMELFSELFSVLSHSLAVGPSIVLSIVGLLATFYYMVFRGVLFRSLSTSSRRKRIYAERTR